MSGALSTTNLSVHYGGVVALSDVTLSVSPGEIVGLIGPNGAGKTTCIDAISGFARASGEVHLGEARLDGLSAHERARRGTARTWQLSELFDDLTVRENLSVVSMRSSVLQTAAELFSPRQRSDGFIDELLDQLGISDLADQSAAQLTEGQRKIVGVGRALASRPQILLLDEPAAGLDSVESHHFGDVLRGVAAQGIGMLLVDHDMGLVMAVCDRIVVLDFGRVIAEGTPAQIISNEAVIAAYLGASGSTNEEEVTA